VTRSSHEPPDDPGPVMQAEELEAFYREHLPFVRQYLARRVDDPLTVADLTADVFVGVIRSNKTYRRELGPPRAWLTGIARNVLADHWLSDARSDATVRQLHGRRLLDDDSTDRIVQRIAAETDARALLSSIAGLPTALRSVVELVAVDGLAVSEAAAILHISSGAARVRYHRARRLLRQSAPLHLLEVTP
jgi:RNA polymerase sigma factor (sigma-70 family)